MSFQAIHNILDRLDAPVEAGQIELQWVVGHDLAVGLDASACHIVLLGDGAVTSASESVDRHLHRGRWLTSEGRSVTGTVLRLPAAPEFATAAAAIAAELERRGIGVASTREVFVQVEPFIELLLARELLPHESVIGLIGELIVLDTLVSSDCAGDAPERTACWKRYSGASRDFVAGDLVLEVKTTLGDRSHHRIASLSQVEPVQLDDNRVETLRLISIGLRAVDTETGGWSVAGLVERLLGRLEEAEGTRFLEQLSAYGPLGSARYEHARMASWAPYSRRYGSAFEPRVYDLTDPRVRLIRRSDLDGTLVQPQSMSYVLELPATIPGTYGRNPVIGLRDELTRLTA